MFCMIARTSCDIAVDLNSIRLPDNCSPQSKPLYNLQKAVKEDLSHLIVPQGLAQKPFDIARNELRSI